MTPDQRKPVPDQSERDRIVKELRRHSWNKKAAAKDLGIAKSTLHEKIKKYDITEE